MNFIGLKQLSGSKIIEINQVFYVYINNQHKATFATLKYAISYLCRANCIKEISLGDFDKFFELSALELEKKDGK